MKYHIPFAWSIIFDDISPVADGLYKTTVSFAKEKLASNKITLENVERQIAEYSGWDVEQWNSHRKYLLGQHDSINGEGSKDENGFNEDDFDPDYELESMEDEGMIDLTALFRLTLALEYTKEERNVILNLRDFVKYYKEDNENPEKIKSDVRGTFIKKVNAYNYLFSHTVGTKDQHQLILDRIRLFNENQLIDQVLVPILSNFGFRNIERIPHHGPNELGLDIRPFYEVDKFDNRIYYGAQVKAINIHTNSRKEGHVEDIIRQLFHAFDSWFMDREDNENKKIDRVMLVTSQRINDSAKKVLKENFPNRRLVMIDGEALARYAVEFGLATKILQSKIPYERLRRKRVE